MPLESATYISDLDPSNPVGSSDLVSSLDDHMRLVKATLQTTFPGITGEVTATHVELNHLDGVTGTTGTGKLVLDDAPTIADLTVTDSITLPANSVADAALSDNIMKKNVGNVCPAQDPIIGSHPTNTVIRRTDNTGAIQIYPGTTLAGATGNARLLLFSGSHPDTPGAATLQALGTGVLTLQSTSGIALNGNTNLSGTLAVSGAATFNNNVTVSGAISGNGSGLTNLNADNLSSGTVPSARLPATIGGNKTFSGNVTISGALTASSTLSVTGAATFAANVSLTGNRTIDATTRLNLTGSTVSVGENGGALGFYGSAGISKPTVGGKINDGTALMALLTQLEALGLITKAWTET